MKFIRILHNYLKGIRLSAAVLAVMMTWAMVCGVIVFGKVQHINGDLNALSGANTQNAYLLLYFSSESDIKTGADLVYAQKTEPLLEAEAAVKAVFSVRLAAPVTYEGERVNLVLYEPEMLHLFPALKKTGMDFTGNPNGCILVGDRFQALKPGDTIPLQASGREVEFPVNSRLPASYKRFNMTRSSTYLTASDLFTDSGDTILMQATEEVMTRLEGFTKRLQYNCNMIAVFQEGTSQAEVDALLAEKAGKYLAYPLSQVLDNSRTMSENTLKKELPQPLFLAVSSMVAFLSIAVLTIQKKKRDISFLYLCGASRRKCGLVVFTAFQIFMAVPVLLNVLLILGWQRMLRFLLSLIRFPNLWLFFDVLFFRATNIAVDSSCLWVVFGYYLGTTAIALAVTLRSMARHTPVTYLRGVSR